VRRRTAFNSSSNSHTLCPRVEISVTSHQSQHAPYSHQQQKGQSWYSLALMKLKALIVPCWRIAGSVGTVTNTCTVRRLQTPQEFGLGSAASSEATRLWSTFRTNYSGIKAQIDMVALVPLGPRSHPAFKRNTVLIPCVSSHVNLNQMGSAPRSTITGSLISRRTFG